MAKRSVLILVASTLTAAMLGGCVVLAPHSASPPDAPIGQVTGLVGDAMDLRAEGAACSRGHTLEWQWDFGAGSCSDWLAGSVVAHAWDVPGTYQVRVRVRCQESHAVISPWSESVTVFVLSYPSPSSQAR
ncbi:MAG: PKD domain-containing protein [Candidatus Bipolaricaulota bacterium]